MIEIKKINKKSDIKKFVDFPVKYLYKDCKYFVPPIFIDEVNMFLPNKNACFEDTDVQCFLAYRDGKIVGRIAGLIQKTFNKMHNTSKVRFTRFDCYDDQEVANALFDAVENWAHEKGMTEVHGPLGFNDLDREALLIDGFNELSTYETQYNYPYYQRLIENYGFEKDCDYTESQIFIPKQLDERVERLSGMIMKRYNLKIAQEKNKNKFIEKYKSQIFDLIDEAYSELYGVVPYSEKVREQFIANFKLILNLRYCCVILDENDKLIGFGITFPSLAEAVRDSKGKLLPFGIFRMLKAIKKPKIMDLALIAVNKEYRNKGIPALLFNEILKNYIEDGIEYAETNLNMVGNDNIHAQWKNFEHRTHKYRRCFKKNINK